MKHDFERINKLVRLVRLAWRRYAQIRDQGPADKRVILRRLRHIQLLAEYYKANALPTRQ